jgi:hypothetical protein
MSGWSKNLDWLVGLHKHESAQNDSETVRAKLLDTLNLGLGLVASIYLLKYGMDMMRDGMNGASKDEISSMAQKLAQKLGRPEIANMEFDG